MVAQLRQRLDATSHGDQTKAAGGLGDKVADSLLGRELNPLGVPAEHLVHK